MNTFVFETRTGPDGTLHLNVPFGIEKANLPVRVVIEPSSKTMPAEEWATFVQSIAGSITDTTFERPPQLPMEVREPLS